MTKTIKALRIELEDMKNNFYAMQKEISRNSTKLKREQDRIDRIVQVLLNNLPEKQLKKKVSFVGTDCCGIYRDYRDHRDYTWESSYLDDRITLRDFLKDVIDP